MIRWHLDELRPAAVRLVKRADVVAVSAVSAWEIADVPKESSGAVESAPHRSARRERPAAAPLARRCVLLYLQAQSAPPFNPRRVRAHRLIGYENRLLRDEDFTDDRKDAGVVGAGHSVTAMYELIPADAPADGAVRTPDALRYQTVSWRPEGDGGELMYVRIRYKEPDGFTSREIAHPVRAGEAPDPSGDFVFQTAVAGFGMLLRDSEHKGSADIHRVIANARRGMGPDREGYRKGFIELAELARAAGLERVATAR